MDMYSMVDVCVYPKHVLQWVACVFIQIGLYWWEGSVYFMSNLQLYNPEKHAFE